MDNREWGSDALGVYPTQYTVRVKQKEEADTRITARVRNLEEMNVVTKRKSPNQVMTSAVDLTISSPRNVNLPTID